MADLARMRLEYETVGLSESDLAGDPFEQFHRWLEEAVAAEVYEPNAMVLSTVDAEGQPWSRHLLLKGVNGGGFDFFTNYTSNKSVELAANNRAAMTFGWLDLHRQVNLAGTVEKVPDQESDDYWAVRTRGSQLGGWASDQSAEIDGRQTLDQWYAEAETRFPDVVPRPPHWGGWRLIPHTIEFWQGRQNRMHDRMRYRRASQPEPSADQTASGQAGKVDAAASATNGSGWTVSRLSP